MPLTTDSRWWPESLISWAYSCRRSASISSEPSVGQHFGEADDGIERRAQLVAHGGEEAALGGVGALGLGARLLERLLLRLALGDVAHDRDDLALVPRRRRRLVERTAAHLDPDELRARAASASASRRTRNSTERLSPRAAASASAVR